MKINAIMCQIEKLSEDAKNLDEFGSRSLKQSKEILEIGAPAVYVLSNKLDNADWKVRFWIVDMFGYLNNIDAQRPLKRVLNNKKECQLVRSRALKSMKMLKK